MVVARDERERRKECVEKKICERDIEEKRERREPRQV